MQVYHLDSSLPKGVEKHSYPGLFMPKVIKNKAHETSQIGELLRLVKRVAPYPPGIVPVKQLIAGTAFFPGGNGLWSAQNDGCFADFPFGGIMILGHDFGTLDSQRKSLELGHERECSTWKNMMPFLESAGVSLSDCFFTNFYMGLRESTQITGKFPGANDSAFVQRCQNFLSRQIQFQKPRAILMLGTWVPSLLAPLSRELAPWLKAKSFSRIDQAGGLITHCRFLGVAHPVNVAALTHPSFRGSNVHRRRYGSKTGDAAELAIVKKAIATK
jgi:uracil-DNA glycosylase